MPTAADYAGTPPPPRAEGPQLHNDSTSSSNASSPTSEVPEIYRALQVRVWENQRWFPIVGWGTSRLPADPPNLSPWHHPHPGQQPQHGHTHPPSGAAALHEELLAANQIALAPDGTQRPQQPIFPLSLRLPERYLWDGYWEVSTRHPRGTDPSGWRYAENFTTPATDGGHSAAHFKKTQTPTCVVRRRMWQRQVRPIDGGPTDPTPTRRETRGVPVTDEERAREVYLREKQDEMALAEKLKARRQDAIDNGADWTQDDELAAEEELRSFIRERRQQFTESATRRLSTNNSFANPFQISSVVTVDSPGVDNSEASAEAMFTPARHEGAAAASAWVTESARNRERDGPAGGAVNISDDEDFVKDVQRRGLAEAGSNVTFADESRPTRPDGVQAQDAAGLTFQHHEPSPKEFIAEHDEPHAEADASLQPQSTIDRFVAASTDGDADDEDGTATSPADGGDTNDFNAIFSKFMSSPEVDGGDGPR